MVIYYTLIYGLSLLTQCHIPGPQSFYYTLIYGLSLSTWCHVSVFRGIKLFLVDNTVGLPNFYWKN